MDPINYNVDVQQPLQAALHGYGAGAAIRNDQQQQQQQQAALEQQQRLQGLVARASRPGATADDFQAVMVADPKHAEAYTKAWATKNTAQQQSLAGDLLQWGAAIKSGKPDLATARMLARADAMEATGGPTQESQGLRIQAQLIKEHPEFALGQFQALLAANPNGKDAATALASFGAEQRAEDQAPADLARKEADAKKAGIDAKYAEQGAIIDLQKKGWDIKAIQEDIGFKKEANRIAMMSAAAAREGNALKREELGIKIQEARTAMDDKIRTKMADAESAVGSVDNALNTIERIKKNKSLNNVLGSIEGRVGSYLSDEGSDAIALLEQLSSQAFLAAVPEMKSLGSLSNAEGEKLGSAKVALRRDQSEEQLRDNLDDYARILNKARVNISKRTGIPLGKPDTPAAPGARPPLSSFAKPTGGASGSY